MLGELARVEIQASRPYAHMVETDRPKLLAVSPACGHEPEDRCPVGQIPLGIYVVSPCALTTHRHSFGGMPWTSRNRSPVLGLGTRLVGMPFEAGNASHCARSFMKV